MVSILFLKSLKYVIDDLKIVSFTLLLEYTIFENISIVGFSNINSLNE